MNNLDYIHQEIIRKQQILNCIARFKNLEVKLLTFGMLEIDMMFENKPLIEIIKEENNARQIKNYRNSNSV